MSADDLSMIAGVLLSTGFSYIPGLRKWYTELSPEQKRLVMLGMLALAALAVYGLACGGLAGEFGLGVSCDTPGLLGLARALIVCIASNQAAFLISPCRATLPWGVSPARLR